MFVHGPGRFGAAAWPYQHRLAGRFDCLFLRRHGFAPTAPPLSTDFQADMHIVLANLGEGGHVVAHSHGAISAMMAAVERPDLVRSLTLFEPACLSLTADLPATIAHRERLAPLYATRGDLTDEQYQREFSWLMFGSRPGPLRTRQERREARRLRLQEAPWTAPLNIVPGLPTLVVTGGWEPLYEEVGEYLAATGAVHRHAPGHHRPQDTAEGHGLMLEFLPGHGQ